jgi:DNA-binding CsgD family transcriptional regulator
VPRSPSATNRASPSDRLEVFVRAFGLSPRERDVVAAVAGGLDTRAVGRALGIAELTVQDHLKAVFARTGTATRADLLARAIGLSGSATGSEGS